MNAEGLSFMGVLIFGIAPFTAHLRETMLKNLSDVEDMVEGMVEGMDLIDF